MTREQKPSEVDRSCCCCGTEARHHRYEEHTFVPLGCDCMRASSDEPLEPPW